MSSDFSHVVLVVVSDLSKQDIVDALLAADFHITEIGSTSSLFVTGFSTLLIGVSADRVDKVVQIVRDNSTTALDPGERRAVVYVLRTSEFVTLHPREVTA